MSLDADTSNPRLAPAPEEWVSPREIENYVLRDPLIDWLERHHREHGLPHDRDGDGHDPRTDFNEFMRGRSFEFTQAVVGLLRQRTDVVDLGASDDWSPRCLAATVLAMRGRAPAIWRGFLSHADLKLYGSPCLLVRSDVLAQLFPSALDPAEVHTPAPAIDSAHHYRIIDIEFSTLRLSATGEVGSAGSSPAYRAQLALFNLMLGVKQGYEPPVSYLLGRSWEQRAGGKTERGRSCLDRLGRVTQAGQRGGDPPVTVAFAGVEWVRRLRRLGSTWRVLPEPSVPELRPNMSNRLDAPWRTAKRTICAELADVTALWRVGTEGRSTAAAAGVLKWTDPRFTPDLVGMTGESARVLQAILAVNRSDGSPVEPARVSAAEDEWRPVPPCEFFVDFETVTDVADDLARLPSRGGQPLIFMIGCGHFDGEEWVFRCFVAESLTEPAEAKMIDDWLAYMHAAGFARHLHHWSPAETMNLETAYNAAVVRHPTKHWPKLPWFDVLERVVRVEPVVVRGCLGFGLKAFVSALAAHRLIEIAWEDGPTDGLGASVGAWWCAREAAKTGSSITALPLMKQIENYNETDCRAVAEIVRYLRRAH